MKPYGEKWTFGIKAELFLAFGAMAILTAMASAVAWYSFAEIDTSERRVNAEGIVGMAASLRLAEKSAELTAMAPAVIASRSKEEQRQERVKLAHKISELSAVTGAVRTTVVGESRFARLIEIEGKIAIELNVLDDAVEHRLRLSEQKKADVANLAELQGRLQTVLTSLVDNAGFSLVITSENMTTRSKEAITGLVEDGVNALQALMTVRAESNLAAGLLMKTAYVDNPALLPPIREQFFTAAATIERNVKALPRALQTERLRKATEGLIALSAGGGAFSVRLQELQSANDMQSPVRVNRDKTTSSVAVAHKALLETLAPMVDDAGFDLVITSEKVAANSTNGIRELVEDGVNSLLVPLTLRAESNLAAGLLNEAVSIPDPSMIQPLQERFVGTANRMKKLLREVPATTEGAALRALTEKLITFGASEQNVFDLRRLELNQIALAQASLEANNSLVLRLGEEVAALVGDAQNNSDAAAQSAAHAIRNGQILLLLITVLSALGAVLIALRYVVPQVVSPIERITAAMSGLAAGDTSIEVPGRDRNDEIGRMAKALGVFRDTAIAVQKSNELEIRAGRQRLAFAIDSISEAFSLYDREDRLVICNNKYRTILYPDGGVEILPGMTFESVIRQAVERGNVKEAVGRVEEWVTERLARHHDPRDVQVQQRSDGRWVLVSERKTDDGGTVAVYSDITELKQREKELADKTKALEQLSGQLAKYLSAQVYESIFTGRQEVKITSRRKKLTVFFSDVVGFTETTERLESEDLTQLLNHYLSEMSDIAEGFGATIDKYVGDAIVIFFGDPESRGVKDDAVACVEMAIAMRKRMTKLQEVWRGLGNEKPLQCRIGINTGFCTVGNFGSEHRMDYTIIGAGVNLASRLESAAAPGEILISYETYANVRHRINCEERGKISVKGVAHPVATYKVVDTYENLNKERLFIHEDRPNLRLDMDLEEMSAEDRGAAAAVLREALVRLSSLDQV